ncbi:unnamed protein product [Candida verbasci]|uniref:Transcription initiation factor TFIID subunit 13 n=1 Tax=Candida verbasci TaxID=1227364 RepID=A0A9W4TZ46_9ASCO|nr:unnamed protein product [Candida verbasci]
MSNHNPNRSINARIIQEQLPPITFQRKKRKRQRLFTKDIENLLYAMGDKPVSTELTVNTLEDILVDYITQLSYQMLNFARTQNRTRIKLNDLAFVLRNDPLGLARFQYIMEQSYKIERAKKMFDDSTKDFKEDDFDNDDVEEDEEDQHENENENAATQQNTEDGTQTQSTQSSKKSSKEGKKKKRKVTGNVMLKKD